jgi:hypothetical protein
LAFQVSPGLSKLVKSGEVSGLMIPTTANMTMMLSTVDGEQVTYLPFKLTSRFLL